jgi:hypothetical protein
MTNQQEWREQITVPVIVIFGRHRVSICRCRIVRSPTNAADPLPQRL